MAKRRKKVVAQIAKPHEAAQPAAQPQPNDLLTPGEVTKMLRLKNEGTLAVWRCTGRHALPFIKIGGGRILYRKSDVEKFLISQLRGVAA